MNTGFLTFEITDIKQKKSFTNMLDWEANYKKLQCVAHRKNPKLDLSIDKTGPSVVIRACCDDFFKQIVKNKNL